MSLTIKDLERLQSQNPDWRMKLVEGNIIVMGPSDYESDLKLKCDRPLCSDRT